MSPSIERAPSIIWSEGYAVPHFVVRLADNVPFDPKVFEKWAGELDSNERIQLRFLVVAGSMYCFPNARKNDVRFNAFSSENVYEVLKEKGDLQAAGRILVNRNSHNRYIAFETETPAVNKNPEGNFIKIFGSFFTFV